MSRTSRNTTSWVGVFILLNKASDSRFLLSVKCLLYIFYWLVCMCIFRWVFWSFSVAIHLYIRLHSCIVMGAVVCLLFWLFFPAVQIHYFDGCRCTSFLYLDTWTYVYIEGCLHWSCWSASTSMSMLGFHLPVFTFWIHVCAYVHRPHPLFQHTNIFHMFYITSSSIRFFVKETSTDMNQCKRAFTLGAISWRDITARLTLKMGYKEIDKFIYTRCDMEQCHRAS